MAGLPQRGETLLGIRFFKHQFSCTSLLPLFLSGGKSIYSLFCVGEFTILVKTTT